MKKGSVSIFFIIAIIIVGVVIAYIFLGRNTNVVENKININPQTAPVDNLITSCLELSLEDAFKTMAKNGGWLSTEIFDVNYEDPTDGSVLPINKNEKVVYWYFMVDNNYCTENCRFGSLAPTLEQIKKQAERFCEINTLKCFVDNWNLSDDYKIYIKDLPEVNIEIKDEEVKAEMNFPIDVEKKGSESLIHREHYYAKSKIPFKKMWRIANEIMQYEASSRFLEINVLNLLSIYSGKDEKKLPPQYDISFFDYSPKTWQADVVRSRIKEMLTGYLNQITIKNSKNEHFSIKSKGEKKVFEKFMVWDIKDKDVKNYNINFYYNPKWKPFIAFGNQEGIIIPKNLLPQDKDMLYSILGIAGLERYQTLYDISFPILVELKDKDALNGQGFVFRFALEGNIRNNDVLKSTSKVSYGSDDSVSLCDKRTWERNHKISVTDYKGNKLKDVALRIEGLGNICGLGYTNENGVLVTKVPEGVFTLKAYKEGYFIPSKKISSKRSSSMLTAYPEKVLNITIGKSLINYNDVDYGRITFKMDNFDQFEKGVFIMYNIENPKYAVTFKINNSKVFSKSVKLVPGKYRVFSVVLYNQSIKLKGECLIGTEEHCIKRTESINISNIPVSIVSIDNLKLDENMYNYDKLMISIPVLPQPKSVKDLTKVSEMKNLLKENPDLFRVRFE